MSYISYSITMVKQYKTHFRRIILALLLLVPLAALSATPARPLQVDQAFQFTASARDSQTLLLHWTIAPGYYLYRDRFHFKILQPKHAKLGRALWPSSKTISHDALGTYRVYAGKLTIPLPVVRGDGKKLLVQVEYQGCSKSGYCYPPTTKVASINLAGHYGVAKPGLAIDVPTAQARANRQTLTAEPETAEDQIDALFHGRNVWLFLLGFLGFGILISLTPCVLPMIPILSSIIVGQGAALTPRRSFGLSLAYVSGMALTYAAAGMLFGWIGGTVQAVMQQPWIIVLFSLVFVGLALSLFGLYELQLPRRVRHYFAVLSQRQKVGSYWGVAVMGCFSTLILSPCVTPPLVAVLSYIGQTGHAMLGAAALLCMGFGMGLPLLLIGAFGGRVLPKVGLWMEGINYAMGVLLLAVAVWMLSRVVPAWADMLLWAGLAMLSALLLGAFSKTQDTWAVVRKGIGLLFFVYAALLVFATLSGRYDPLKPWVAFHAESSEAALKFIPVKTVEDVKKQLRLAKHADQLVLLDFYADWCISCKEMEHFTFTHPDVRHRLRGYRLLRANVTANDAVDKRLEQHFGVVAPPTILFFNRHGQELQALRIIGAVTASQFLQHLDKVDKSE